MENLYEDSLISSFLKRLVTSRANRFNTMFRRGKGHDEYKGLAESLGLKSLEVVGYSSMSNNGIKFIILTRHSSKYIKSLENKVKIATKQDTR